MIPGEVFDDTALDVVEPTHPNPVDGITELDREFGRDKLDAHQFNRVRRLCRRRREPQGDYADNGEEPRTHAMIRSDQTVVDKPAEPVATSQRWPACPTVQSQDWCPVSAALPSRAVP